MSCDAQLRLLALLFRGTILDEPHAWIGTHIEGHSYIRLITEDGVSQGFGLAKENSMGYGRLLDPSWMDPRLISQWKRDCASLHGSKCMRVPNSAFLAPASPNWLVDVQQKCIVPAKQGMPYVALSYVWGTSGQLTAVKSNLAELQTPGILNGSDEYLVPPQTIRDAMAVVTLLGERYIWVDALCIVQDDESTKVRQLNNMASIYGEAAVTIIAKDGINSAFGIRGIAGSLPRNLDQSVFRLSNGRAAVVYPWTLDKKPTPWSSRGWTFQENLFSSRKLIFEGETVRWECSSAVWHEDHDFRINPEEECNDADEDILGRGSRIFEIQEPDLQFYGWLVRVYNKRYFTYNTDVLQAFAGILSILIRNFKGGFHFGLPLVFFDLSLLWQPNGVITRRRSEYDGTNGTIPPSWSWAGWQGEIDTEAWGNGPAKKVSEWTESTQVTAKPEWCICESLGNEKELIQNACFSPPTATTKTILTCQTDRCFLYFGKQHSRGLKKAFRFFSIVDKNGNWAGSLRPHAYFHPDQGAFDINSKPSKENQCELVSISKGYAEEGVGVNAWMNVGEWKMDERPRLLDTYRFHNVLWVVWENGIAQRRGLGRVMEEVWQRQDLEQIELFLG
jgi:hypothetical protein